MEERLVILEEEWDDERNVGKLSDYSLGSHKKVWWICKKNPCGCHRWEMTIKLRTNINTPYGGQNCPYCSRRKICEHNNVLYLHPELCEEWDYERNTVDPTTLAPKSGKKVWWVCKKNPCGCHKWEAKIADRVIKNSGCPYCPTSARRRVCPHYNLKTAFPDLCEEWDYERNKTTPEEYTPFSKSVVWWICKKNPCGCHKWKTSINWRTNTGIGCAYCANQKLCEHNNVLVTHPKICKEWNYDKNKTKPENYSYGSTKKVWWKCSNNEKHIWYTTIYSRTVTESNCPRCNISKGEKEYMNI